MRMYPLQRKQSGQLLVYLMIVTLVVSACSIISVPEDAQSAYQGPPQVSIAAPQPNDTYREGVGVNVLVRVENAGPDIARVAISLDGQIIGEAPLPNPDGAPGFTVRNSWTAAGVGQHTISVSASRADGTQSNPVSIPINVVADPASQTATANTTSDTTTSDNTEAQSVQEQPTSAPTNTLPPPTQVQPTDEPEPTEPPPTEPPANPQIRVATGANIRRGPGTNFEPPIGSLAAGATSDILAVSTDGTWYKIRYYNSDGWIFGQTVEVVGDASNIPREAGPPTPIPFTPTPVPTNTPTAVADLSITASSTVPEFECGNASEITLTITNSGTGNSESTRVVVEDVYNGRVIESTEAPVRVLAPNDSTIVTLYLTVSTNVYEGHQSRFRVDPENLVAETNENNNNQERTYVLNAGACG